jgi:tRNA U38,U39,U40 pseudouridine synthase TruA
MRVIDARFVHDAFEPKLAATQRIYLYRFMVSYFFLWKFIN